MQIKIEFSKIQSLIQKLSWKKLKTMNLFSISFSFLKVQKRFFFLIYGPVNKEIIGLKQSTKHTNAKRKKDSNTIIFFIFQKEKFSKRLKLL